MTLFEFGTWLSVIVLGPGAALIFLWFLWEMRQMARSSRK